MYMNFELRKLTINDGMDIYAMLQEIPKDENGFINFWNLRKKGGNYGRINEFKRNIYNGKH